MGSRHGLDMTLHLGLEAVINEEGEGLCAMVVRATVFGARQNSGTNSST